MLDIKFIRENLEFVKEGVRKKKAVVDFDLLLSLDDKRRNKIQRSESLKAELNRANQIIKEKKKKNEDISDLIAKLKDISKEAKEIEASLREDEAELREILLRVPNIPHDSVPEGGEENNKVVKTWGDIPQFDFQPKDHLALANGIDMQRGAKITGSGFPLYVGESARLERALINFMLDFHIKKHGYTEVFPPFIVNRKTMTGTGQLPKMEEDMYALKDEDMFLIPTAEVPVTNIHRDEILKEEELPVKYVSYTPCFRREAGSYGKDTRGLTRIHQFDKVEMVRFVKPESSYEALEELVNDAGDILKVLGIPYRVLLLAAGDISFAAAKCYDIEVWAPGLGRWLEVSSCSNFEDFQARRANIKYRPKDSKKPAYLHTLNGSGLALPRLVIAVLENFQNSKGDIRYPKILRPYLTSIAL